MSFPALFSPLKVGTLEPQNRFVIPPMGTNYAYSAIKLQDVACVWPVLYE